MTYWSATGRRDPCRTSNATPAPPRRRCRGRHARLPRLKVPRQFGPSHSPSGPLSARVSPAERSGTCGIPRNGEVDRARETGVSAVAAGADAAGDIAASDAGRHHAEPGQRPHLVLLTVFAKSRSVRSGRSSGRAGRWRAVSPRSPRGHEERGPAPSCIRSHVASWGRLGSRRRSSPGASDRARETTPRPMPWSLGGRLATDRPGRHRFCARYRPGVAPTRLRNSRVMWLWSANPQLQAMSSSGVLVRCSKVLARSTRCRRTNSCGVVPVDCRKRRAKW